MNMMFNLMAVFKNTVKNNEEILGQEITVNNREEYLGEQITNASDTIAGAIEKMDMTVTKYIEDTRLNEKTAIDWPGKFIVVYFAGSGSESFRITTSDVHSTSSEFHK